MAGFVRNTHYLAGLTVVTSCLASKIRLANGKRGSITLTASDFAIFAALLMFGPEVAALIGAIEGLVSSVRVRIRRLYKYLFNISQVSLVAFLVGKVYQECLARELFLDTTQGPQVIGLLLTLLFCAILFFMINSTLVTVALSLVTVQPAVTFWRQNLLWISPSTFTSASAAAVIFLSTQSIGLFLALAIVPLIVGTYYAHQIQLSRRGVEQDSFSGSHLMRMTHLRFFEDKLPNQAKGYIVTVILGAFPLLLYSVVHTLGQPQQGWLYLAGLTILATCFPVRIGLFNDRLWITLSDIFVVSAMLHLGPQAAVLIAAAEALTFNFRMKVQGGYRRIFNIAQITIVAFLTGHLLSQLLALIGTPNPSQIVDSAIALAITLLCGAVYFLLTSGFSAGAAALANWHTFAPIWRRSLAWAPVGLLGVALGTLAFLYS